MNENIARDKALILVEQAYRQQMRGDLTEAMETYQRSIDTYPTAEGFTFLGWTFSMMDRYHDAIEACEQAIAVDPEFGNPYNDIGSYLIALDRWEEAIPWLERATTAERYDARHFPFINLGHIYEYMGDFDEAMASYDRALAHDPYDRSALWAKYELVGRLN